MTDNQTTPEAAVVADLARRAADVKYVPTEYGDNLVLYQDGERVGVIDLQTFADGPRLDSRRGEKVYTPASFVAYLKRYANPDLTLIRVDEQDATVYAVLDYLNSDMTGPGWRANTVRLSLTHTPEWKAWQRQSGQMVGQDDFAEFIERQLPVFTDPDGATMLEIAQSMQGANQVQWQKATRLSNGEAKFEYIENIEARAGRRGDIAIPETFHIAVQPFAGGPKFAISAALRWRLNGGTLRIGYVIARPRDVEDAAFASIVSVVRSEMNPGDSDEWAFIDGNHAPMGQDRL